MARFFVMRKEKQILSSAQDDSHSERSEESASGCGLGPRCEKVTTEAQRPVLYSTGQRHRASDFLSDSVPCLRQGFGRRALCLCGLTGVRILRKASESGFVLSDFGTPPCVFNNLLALFFDKNVYRMARPRISYLAFSFRRRLIN